MKKIKLIIPVCVLLLGLMLFGCGFEKNGYEFGDGSGVVEGDGDVQIMTEPLYGIENYYIIRGDLASDMEKEAMMRLKNAIKGALDIDVPSSTDWIGGDQVEHDREIVVGDTERPATQTAKKGLAFGDFVIKRTGEKIVIVGGSDSATLAAVDFFISHFINVYGACLDVPAGEGYVYTHDYMFDSLTVDGTDIAEFQLYAAPGVDIGGVSEYIAENVYGVLLPVASEMTSSGKYIIFDNSGLIANGFSIELRYDGNLYVVGSVDTAQYAVEYFKTDFFESLARKGTDGNIAIQDNYAGNTGKSPEYMTKDEIVARLEAATAEESEILWGQQGTSFADPAYILDDFSTAVGETPDILCIDLFSYGLHIDELTPAERSEILCDLADFAARGGIISVSAYFENPTEGWELGDEVTGNLKTKENWGSLVNEGSDLNKKFLRQLDCAAEFLGALCDNGIAVIFKPFEGHNQSKYWYSPMGKGADSESFAALWTYVYNYLSEGGCTNLLWQYTPCVTKGALELFDAYPGEEYVDLIGGFWTDVGVKSVSEEYLFGLARHGKPVGIMTLTVSSKKISSNKDKQVLQFNCNNLAETVFSAKESGIRLSSAVTFGTSSNPSWLGKGEALAARQEQ